jgi:putative heme-binding domain-containing protein
MSIIDCLETARSVEGGGGSYELYLQRAVEDVAKTMTPDQLDIVFDNGSRWPNAVVAAFYKLPTQLDEATVNRLIELDQSVKPPQDGANQDAATEQLRLGVIAVLARSGDESSMEYLRQLWQSEESRRNDIVIGLSQQPGGENWAYLVSSLPELDDLTAREVLQKLVEVSRRPQEPKYFRDVIELGYRLRTQGASEAIQLLEHWSGQQQALENGSWKEQLNAWKVWFQTSWPDQADLTVEESAPSSQRSIEQVLSYLEQNGMGDAARGQKLFVSAQCATCHQLGGVGQNVGPDLSTVALRFSQRELLEATLEPSKVIPDRYASKILLTIDGKQFHGMAVEQPDDSIVVLTSDGKRVRVQAEDIEDVKDSELSAMPAGLLDQLSLSEISDLMAFMMRPEPAIANQTPAGVESTDSVVR